jgi:hypothetical protein
VLFQSKKDSSIRRAFISGLNYKPFKSIWEDSFYQGSFAQLLIPLGRLSENHIEIIPSARTILSTLKNSCASLNSGTTMRKMERLK